MGVIQGHAKLLESKLTDDAGALAAPDHPGADRAHLEDHPEPRSTWRVRAAPRAPPSRLAPLLDNTLAFLREKFARREIRVVRELEEVPSIRGDSERLQQLFLNLFMNAADAMPDGGELHVALRARSPAGIEVEVRDTGMGIPGDDLGRIFDPFFTTKPAGHGNGLGLSVVRSIVGDHGGDIEVRSEVGVGTTFTIQLPVSSAPTRP